MTAPEAQALQEHEIIRHSLTGDFGRVLRMDDNIYVIIGWGCGPNGDKFPTDLSRQRVTEMRGIERCQDPRFAETSCSQCGREFGPGNYGFSNCKNHKGKFGVR